MEKWIYIKIKILQEVKRLIVPIVVGLVSLILLLILGQGRYIVSLLSVLLKLSVGFVFFHCIWETFFDYFQLGRLYSEAKTEDAELFKAVAIFRAILVAAWLIAMALAL